MYDTRCRTLIAIALVVCAFGVLVLAPNVHGQTNRATLSGTVLDPSGAVVPGVKITLTNRDTNACRDAKTDKQGYFVLTQLEPGKYILRARREGFATTDVSDITLSTAERRNLEIKLQVGKASESMTVSSSATEIKVGGGTETLLNRKLVDTAPLNGRSFQSLMLATPGAILDHSTGYISFNGMRSDMNYFTVDGVGASVGTNNLSLYSPTGADPQSLAGTTPGFTAFGGTQAIMNIDALEEFKVQGSALSAQFGRQMGAQVQLTSRSGTNVFHGSAFDFLRNDALDAAPVYPFHPEEKKPKLRQNNFGASLGGPIIKDRTMFFFSYEGMRNVLPLTKNVFPVPSVGLRNDSLVPNNVRAILKMYPLPNTTCDDPKNGLQPSPSNPMECVYTFAPDLRSGLSLWHGVRSSHPSADNWSLKVDHTLSSRLAGFVRYNQSDSDAQTATGAMDLTSTTSGTKNVTLGLNWLLSNNVSNSLRANFTKSGGNATYGLGQIHDGGIAPGANPILDPIVTGFKRGGLSLGALNLQLGGNQGDLNRQWNIADDLNWSYGKHTFQAGIDWRYLYPHMPASSSVFVSLANFGNATDLYSNTFNRMSMEVTNGATVVSQNYSLYLQDTWRATPKLTLEMGVRWELNPSPHGRNPGDLRFVTGWDKPGTMALAPAGTKYYDMPWTAFAPRLGASYQISNRSGWETTLSGGWGLFYDLVGGNALGAVGNYPMLRTLDVVGSFDPPRPLADYGTAIVARPAPMTDVPPYLSGQYFMGRMDKLSGLPKSYQWNVGLQQALGSSQSITVSYVGNLGRNMLRMMQLSEDGTKDQTVHKFVNPNFPDGFFTIGRNDSGWGDTSDYHSMQVQYQRRMSKGLQTTANWTWAHGIDTNSSSYDAVNNWDAPAKARGNSDFDRRHVLNVVVNYELPKVTGLGNLWSPAAAAVKTVANGWSFNTNIKAETGTPMTVKVYRDMRPYENSGSFEARADLVPGQPVWLTDPSAAGGKRLNPKAFVVPASCYRGNPLDCQHGSSVRNGIRGFGFWQSDVSISRFFPITERVKLEFRADLLNALNHRNWANPDGNLGLIYTDTDPDTGAPVGVLIPNGMPTGDKTGNILSNAIKGGLNSIYQAGGPRSIQLALKLSF